MTTTTLYLIRHGETDWNLSGHWQGHADVPLNAVGKRQADLLAQRLRRERTRFNVLYSSDLARAYQTAWVISEAVGVPVEMLPALREIDLGIWSGLTREQIRARHPVEFALLEQGQDVPRGGAETLAALRRRVVEVIEAMMAQHSGETLAFVTHGGPVRMFIAHASGVADANRMPFHHIGNTSITVVRHSAAGWQIVKRNDMDHVKDQPQAPDLMSAPPDDAELPQEWNP
jgi:broad specificity phosphatase PhoE